RATRERCFGSNRAKARFDRSSALAERLGPRFRGDDSVGILITGLGTASPVMYQQLVEIIAPVLMVAGLGYLWARLGKPFDLATISGVVINIAVPALVISSLTK